MYRESEVPSLHALVLLSHCGLNFTSRFEIVNKPMTAQRKYTVFNAYTLSAWYLKSTVDQHVNTAQAKEYNAYQYRQW